ncbi:tRNA (adenosine(37)-N6)-threonylcarbamoyltransferase complex dimerization subunit type 1 TsaB [Sphingomonas sp. So64.6b]|uniref:tRNA (adenosine(37)-N6)-threonylcarbamoyltransferase complex dimerization subunit type 1 TsaB n=1 Tax=Sphingomonas sp. So64.6b TaxID=2997354 RepID=UPI001861A969|nr:tRNA (adenosine(37)-N6)-threonylcarbamoyltransferase complex dimerization subunit type 1 TsaB [Sphingomonas sp. So64.6b]QNA84524.1 tRNA (adenosine(37)-N6)-threonylcarbamoyltransferase complex dimerization subunit type 1 TsaB [Sphingomonas sp. So64.6b]
MRTLVIETATAACSVALIESGAVIASCHEVVGRGHAERLIPMIAELPDGGRADRILVDCGPGSFTGVRVGIAAARALAFGWQAGVHGFSSLPLIAAAGFAARPERDTLAVVLEGGHGEVFMQLFHAPLAAAGPFGSLQPEAALAALGDHLAIGNGVHWLSALDPALDVTERLPDAADATLLPAEFTNLPARPIYGRAPDAKPQAA